MTAAPLPIPPPHDRLLCAAREWMRRLWGRHLARIDAEFSDDSVASLAPRISGMRVPESPTQLIGQPLDRGLFDAARCWGVSVREEYPCVLHLIATDGSAAMLTIPPHFPGDADPDPDPPHFDGPEEAAGPAPSAWSFTDDRATYRGQSFGCRGLPLKLLKALANPPGDEIPNSQLIAAVWGERYAASDQQLRNLVGRLRDLLAEKLQPDTSTIVACGGAHKLTLV